MKKLMIILSCTLLIFAAGCKNNKPNEPVEPQSLAANITKPSWTASDDYDYSSSMTAIIQVDLSKTYPEAVDANGQIVNSQIVNESDLLAAFQDDICVGITSPDDGLFYLYISSTETVEPSEYSPSSITLRYYSAVLKNIFEAKDAFEFQNDAMLGSVANPLTYSWKIAE